MNEFLFVLKCMAITAAIVTMSQMNIHGMSIEEHFDNSLRTSKVAVWIQEAATGGALAISRGAHSLSDGVSGHGSATHSQRAGR